MRLHSLQEIGFPVLQLLISQYRQMAFHGDHGGLSLPSQMSNMILTQWGFLASKLASLLKCGKIVFPAQEQPNLAYSHRLLTMVGCCDVAMRQKVCLENLKKYYVFDFPTKII